MEGRFPARMVPPYTMIAGWLRRPMAMTTPGLFLSQPGSATRSSYHHKRGRRGGEGSWRG